MKQRKFEEKLSLDQKQKKNTTLYKGKTYNINIYFIVNDINNLVL